MIISMHVEKLSPHLAGLSKLLDAYQQGDPSFPDAALRWLDEAEKTMGALRIPEGSEMSVLCASILKSTDALRSRERGSDDDGPSRSLLRAARNAAAATAIQRGEEILRVRVKNAEDRLGQFEEKLCEGMTALLLLVPLPNGAAGRASWLAEVWGLLRQQESTKALALYVAASLSMVDRLYILDRILTRMDEKPAEDVVPDPVSAIGTESR